MKKKLVEKQPDQHLPKESWQPIYLKLQAVKLLDVSREPLTREKPGLTRAVKEHRAKSTKRSSTNDDTLPC